MPLDFSTKFEWFQSSSDQAKRMVLRLAKGSPLGNAQAQPEDSRAMRNRSGAVRLRREQYYVRAFERGSIYRSYRISRGSGGVPRLLFYPHKSCPLSQITWKFFVQRRHWITALSEIRAKRAKKFNLEVVINPGVNGDWKLNLLDAFGRRSV